MMVEFLLNILCDRINVDLWVGFECLEVLGMQQIRVLGLLVLGQVGGVSIIWGDWNDGDFVLCLFVGFE